MPQREVIQSSSGRLSFEFNWLDAPAARFGSTYGDLKVRLGDHPVWTAPADGYHAEGTTGLWIELLEYLGTYWLYLVLEQGYPFNVNPVKPSQLDDALAGHWECVPNERQAVEEEDAYSFKVSHNLAECSPGTLRPDLWLVRDGGVFIIEAQTGTRSVLEHLPSEEVKKVLSLVGDAIARRVEPASDPRSSNAHAQWANRDRADFALQTRIATGVSPEYLDDIRGSRRFEEAFVDPESSWAGDNAFLDVVYRCKGVIPADRMRAVLDRMRMTPVSVSPALEAISSKALEQLARTENEWSKPYAQGHGVARWLRAETVGPSARVEPERFLENWGVALARHDFSARHIDAVAFWPHRHSPTVLWNPSEKHISNEGARRATLCHEICHLLIDRSEALPLTAVVGGAMERRLEQRANAFAAELLCPRKEAFAEYQRRPDVAATVRELTIRFGVSNELAAIQLARSGHRFDPGPQREIEDLGPPGAHYPWP